MNSKDIEDWVRHTTTICAAYFPEAVANVTVHFIMDRWIVRVDSPEICERGDTAEMALEAARSKIHALIDGQQAIARTLGLEAAE